MKTNPGDVIYLIAISLGSIAFLLRLFLKLVELSGGF